MYERALGLGRLAMMAITIAALFVLPGAPALAAVRAIAVSPNGGPPLATIKVTGSGFCPAPCGRVSISVGALYVASGVKVHADGRFTTFVRMPGTVRPGPVTITAAQTGRHGAQASAQTMFTVTPGLPPPISYPPPSTIQPPGGLPPPSGKPTHYHATSPAPPPTGSAGPIAQPTQAVSPVSATSAAGHGNSLVYWLPLAALLAVGVAVASWLWRRRHRGLGGQAK